MASMSVPPRLSAVVPVYNEKDNLVPLVTELVRELDRIGSPYEILLVDDGSTDGSRELLEEIARGHRGVRVIHLDGNYGQSAATSAAFDAVRGEWIVTLDADLQNDPADIARLMEWIPRFDMVAGYRRRRHDSLLRRISSRVANRVRSRVLGDGIRDTGCSLKLFRSTFARRMPRFNGMHRFLPFLVQLQGGTVTEVAVNHRPRRAGDSKYGVRNRLFRGILDLIGLTWMRRRALRHRVGWEFPGPEEHGSRARTRSEEQER